MKYKSLVKNQNYMLLQSANWINRLGDSIDAIALSWLIYQISGSASVSALNFALNYLPTVLLQPLMGAYVENKDKKKMMVLADSCRAILVAVLAWFVFNHQIQAWLIIACTFLMSCFETLRLPCGNAIIPSIIDREDYRIATSFSSSTSRIVELIGMGLAGLIVGSLGIYIAIVIDAASFALSAGFLVLMRVKKISNEPSEKTSFLQHFQEGILYVIQHREIYYLCVLVALANMLLVPFNSLQSAFIQSYYHQGALFLSLIGFSFTVGSLVGGAIYPLFNRLVSNRFTVIMIFPACAFFYLGLLALGLVTNDMIMMVLLGSLTCLVGVIVGIANCSFSVLIMLKTDPGYLSRVGGFCNAFGTGMVPVTSVMVSLCVSWLSIETLFLISGIMIAIIGIVAGCNRQMEVLND